MIQLLDRLGKIPGGHRGFARLLAQRDGMSASIGRKWKWRKYQLSTAVTSKVNWNREWDVGAGVTFTF